jgi:hypothetical protein
VDEQLRDRAAPTPAWAWFEPGNAAPPPQMLAVSPLEIVRPEAATGPDPYLVCPGCGATMYERGCKLRCRCGYFLSCSDI